jgi:hypothetical protein
MGRPKKVINQTTDEAGNVTSEEVVEVQEVESEQPESMESLGALKAEVERLRQLTNDLPLEEALKSNTFGTRMYLNVNRFVRQDPRNPNITRYHVVALSVFPNLVDKSGEQIAPDIGFDNKEQADELRNSEKTTIFRGKEVKIKDALKTLQREYFDRRRKGDADFIKNRIVVPA